MNPRVLARDVALDLVPRRTASRIAIRLFGGALFVTAVALWLTPCQQTVSAQGRVIAFDPLERQQDLQTPIAGRLVEWYVREGDTVEAGALLALVEDNDPTYADRLDVKRQAVEDRAATARRSLTVYEQQVVALESARTQAIAAAGERVKSARDKVVSAEHAVIAATAEVDAAASNVERQRQLESKGLASTRTLELAELAVRNAIASKDQALAAVRVARADVRAQEAERARVEAALRADIDSARARIESARAEVAGQTSALQDAELAVGRQARMQIRAPRAGTILRQLAQAGNQYLSAGAPVAQFVPNTTSRAVELFVSGRDAPLVVPGRKVRLQFEGWPAVQFVGWPSVAVGTFGGVVALVDSAADATGKPRVVVVPDPDDEPWPAPAILRQSTRANGWILLDQVSLGFELWRQWNGFAPSVSTPPPDAMQPKAKP